MNKVHRVARASALRTQRRDREFVLDVYSRVLRLNGVRSFMLIMLLARIPVTAAPIVLTLHVILGPGQGGLGMSYAAAAAVGALVALGSGIGSPVIGRAVDRLGLKPVLAVTTTAQVAFWATSHYCSYTVLLPGALVAGLLSLPVFIVARQSLAARLSENERQAGFALDSMSVELSFAIGPAAGAALITRAGSGWALAAVAVALAAAGTAMVILNPPVTAEHGGRSSVRMRSWLDAEVVAVLLVTVGATITVSGTDVAITATMRHFGHVALVGAVISVWCLGSLVGGFVYGLMRRRVHPVILLLCMAIFTLPVGLATTWWWLALALLPSTIFCAPLISSTVDRLTGLSPAGERGVAMGLHSSALTLGVSMGAPLAGVVIDASSPSYGFISVGVIGLTLAGVAVAVVRGRGGPARPGQPGLASRGVDGREVEVARGVTAPRR